MFLERQVAYQVGPSIELIVLVLLLYSKILIFVPLLPLLRSAE